MTSSKPVEVRDESEWDDEFHPCRNLEIKSEVVTVREVREVVTEETLVV